MACGRGSLPVSAQPSSIPAMPMESCTDLFVDLYAADGEPAAADIRLDAVLVEPAAQEAAEGAAEEEGYETLLEPRRKRHGGERRQVGRCGGNHAPHGRTASRTACERKRLGRMVRESSSALARVPARTCEVAPATLSDRVGFALLSSVQNRHSRKCGLMRPRESSLSLLHCLRMVPGYSTAFGFRAEVPPALLVDGLHALGQTSSIA